jgi:hypothetical protein
MDELLAALQIAAAILRGRDIEVVSKISAAIAKAEAK